MRKHLLRVLLLCGLLAVLLCGSALAEDADLLAIRSGVCGADGSDVTWTLDDAGVLTISGTGEIESDYNNENYMPWRDNRYSLYVKQVVIDDGVTNIPNLAFSGAYGYHFTSLESVVIGNSVTSIGEDAFSRCDKLSSVTIGNAVETIGEGAFSYCNQLSNVTFGESVKTIGEDAFNGCSSLSSVSFGNSLETIGEDAFNGCTNLSAVGFGGAKTISDGAFAYCGFVEISIPDSVTEIGSNAFYSNFRLKTVKIGSGISIIPFDAFSYCYELESLTIPVNVTSIDWFWGDDNISTIYYGGTISQWNAITGDGKDFLSNYADNIYYSSSGEETPLHSITFTLSTPTFGVNLPLLITGGTGTRTVNFATAFYDANHRFIGMESAQTSIYPGLRSVFIPVNQWAFTPRLKAFALDEQFRPLSPAPEQNAGTGTDLPDKYADILSEPDADRRAALVDALSTQELREFVKRFAGWLH